MNNLSRHYLIRIAAYATAALCVSTAGAAQTTWIVDAMNGPGTSFLDLPAALDAAAPGDRILVRPGGYSGGRVRKALQIVGGAGVELRSTLRIEAVPDGETFSLSGFHLKMPAQTHGIYIQCPRGAVLLRDVTGDSISPIRIRWTGYVGLSGTFTNVFGESSTLCFSGASVQGVMPGNPAVSANAGTVVVSDSTLTGSPSESSTNPIARGPGVGLNANSSTVRIAGTVRIAAGPQVGGNTKVSPGLAADDSDVVYDPMAVFVGTGRSGQRVRRGSILAAPVPGLGTGGGAIGGPLRVTLSAPPATPFLLGMSRRPLRADTPFGLFVLDPADTTFLTGNATSSQGLFALSLAVPNDPRLRGLGLHFQAATLNSGFGLSLPASMVLH